MAQRRLDNSLGFIQLVFELTCYTPHYVFSEGGDRRGWVGKELKAARQLSEPELICSLLTVSSIKAASVYLSEEPHSHTRDQSTSLNRFPLTLEDNFMKFILQSPKTRSCKAPLSSERSLALPPALTRPATLSWHARVHLPPLCIPANSFHVVSTCKRLQHCTGCILFPCFTTQYTAIGLLRIHLAWMPKTETQQLCSKAPWSPQGRVAWMGLCPRQGSPRLTAFPGPLGWGPRAAITSPGRPAPPWD